MLEPQLNAEIHALAYLYICVEQKEEAGEQRGSVIGKASQTRLTERSGLADIPFLDCIFRDGPQAQEPHRFGQVCC